MDLTLLKNVFINKLNDYNNDDNIIYSDEYNYILKKIIEEYNLKNFYDKIMEKISLKIQKLYIFYKKDMNIQIKSKFNCFKIINCEIDKFIISFYKNLGIKLGLIINTRLSQKPLNEFIKIGLIYYIFNNEIQSCILQNFDYNRYIERI